MSAYNLSQLRVLWEIASDGLVYNHFIAHGNTIGGDYDIMNIKSDIVEQKWRCSTDEPVFFIFDAGMTFDGITTPSRAIVVDTIALIGTNISPNAVVKISAYGDSSSRGVRDRYTGPDLSAQEQFRAQAQWAVTTKMEDDPYETNVLWCSPSEIIQPYRHWMVEILDTANPDGYVEIGRFVAGQASILTDEENFTGDLKYKEKNYKDEIATNGFSMISNNRAIKKNLTLNFDNLNMNGPNYKILRRMMRYIRDTKKSLVIADPLFPYRFSLFAKIEELPEQSISFIDKDSCYASFSINWNEGK